ncbi:unnamed protein product [Rotaria socialis]|uniref:RING-type domain-containing protein n=2 Tax=Rotaria socialis TaxID=392032 RepID=A0A819VYK6_9BILA|nr:unnamed protein product [Rotaria socialis]CAF3334624.1 unnamed protein product [Rotaria socialis]CAF3373779.1 unnamed protein product [Rotaria socialis]CAF3435873.1 unnamed protein product [Rotaria socialis]CAF4117717.1 unnamed protein product [Rotaria socialis]
MSTTSSTSARPVTESTKGDKKKTLCGACEAELEPDHGGIQCVQGHNFCTDCSKQIVSLFFSDPQIYLPLRCVLCHVELNPSVFERQLTPGQVDFYQQHMLVLVWAKELVGEGERLDNCPFCSFAVIRSIDDSTIFNCERPDCRKSSCLICRKVCPRFRNNFATEAQQMEMIKHFTCESLAYEKSLFDQAVERGQKVPCPKCGLSGMKDDACTHMTCPTCAEVWCYFCGLGIELCDKSVDGTNSIFDHNYKWDTNPKRCPMYFTQIQDVDRRWADNEIDCLNRFHRIRSLRLLREVFEQLGSERIQALNNHFHSLDACGFTVDEITNEDLTLIQRRTQRQRRPPPE